VICRSCGQRATCGYASDQRVDLIWTAAHGQPWHWHWHWHRLLASGPAIGSDGWHSAVTCLPPTSGDVRPIVVLSPMIAFWDASVGYGPTHEQLSRLILSAMVFPADTPSPVRVVIGVPRGSGGAAVHNPVAWARWSRGYGGVPARAVEPAGPTGSPFAGPGQTKHHNSLALASISSPTSPGSMMECPMSAETTYNGVITLL
jgi:hypothetical protein